VCQRQAGVCRNNRSRVDTAGEPKVGVPRNGKIHVEGNTLSQGDKCKFRNLNCLHMSDTVNQNQITKTFGSISIPSEIIMKEFRQ
jgi:hypothetical protein